LTGVREKPLSRYWTNDLGNAVNPLLKMLWHTLGQAGVCTGLAAGHRRTQADAFARGDAKPLVNAAQTWLARHGGQAQVDVERLLDPRNTVNGGSIYRDASTGKVMVKKARRGEAPRSRALSTIAQLKFCSLA